VGSYSEFDPIEDTESVLTRPSISYNTCSYSEFDPIEDTESLTLQALQTTWQQLQ